ncbi:hypothetical protein LTR32_004405 [Rachicladosporium monterosium]|uniref:Uncharacterized protein n=1 Tax=Rachicladosporium monterosium TaxID=1507873 RepID=A0ABR0L5X2_9PEZI|nr:hypothetical protein LTR32_004405 [Rachicladosporium monterosium]
MAQERDPQREWFRTVTEYAILLLPPSLLHSQPPPGRYLAAAPKWTHAGGRRRGTASTPGGDEASSPTRRRLNVSGAESDGIYELAKITELSGTDFPRTAESDGTD